MWSGKPRPLQLEIRRRAVDHGVVETAFKARDGQLKNGTVDIKGAFALMRT